MPSEQSTSGVVHELRKSPIDIAVVDADGEDVFIKVGDRVVLVDETEARILASEIEDTLNSETNQRDS